MDRRLNRSREKQGVNIFWFRRDLRIKDNCALFHCLMVRYNVLPIFILDKRLWQIDGKDNTNQLNALYLQLLELKRNLETLGSSLLILSGDSEDRFRELRQQYHIFTVYSNEEYTPLERKRDKFVTRFLDQEKIEHYQYNDNLAVHPKDIVDKHSNPYLKYKDFKRRWESLIQYTPPKSWDNERYFYNFIKIRKTEMPTLKQLGITPQKIETPSVDLSYRRLENYNKDASTHLSIPLSMGAISIRRAIRRSFVGSHALLDSICKRGFYTHHIWHIPDWIKTVVEQKSKLKLTEKQEENFELWCSGSTPDAVVNETMADMNSGKFITHSQRERAARYLISELDIDWRFGERYFASKLVDYNLASNLGNWIRIGYELEKQSIEEFSK